jgi:hypothetical protein
MIAFAVGGGVIGLVVGIMIERYKWVRRGSKNQAIEVDGELYKISKIKVDTENV